MPAAGRASAVEKLRWYYDNRHAARWKRIVRVRL